MVKQVKAVIEEYGLPNRIHVELARDVGKSIEERAEIERGIEKRNKQKDKLRDLFADDWGRRKTASLAVNCCGSTLGAAERTLLQRRIYLSDVARRRRECRPDRPHPAWSRFGDDSFHNKTLCTAKSNQEKKGRTPFEWFNSDKTETEWDAFTARVRAIPYMKGMKRRNYLLKNAAEVEERFRSRNLNDTRWTCRLLTEAVAAGSAGRR